jgi:anaerobic selenocysteine-containing dehydrogenase
MKRRDFVKILGTAVGGLAIPVDLSFASRGSPHNPNAGWAPGIEELTNTTCTLCPGACGITCRVVDGLLVNIRGNTNNPINGGGVCPYGMAGAQLLYSPDRVRGPMVREGKKGEGNWRDVSWEEALNMVKEKVISVKTAGRDEGIVFLSGVSSGSLADVIHYFMRTIGTGEIYLDDQMDAFPHVFSLMHGTPSYPAFDLEGTDLILSFGADLFSAWWCPLQAQSAYGKLMERKLHQKGELIQIEHRMSRNGVCASEWIPINPGSYGALALGMAYILIKEELYDHEFVERMTTGFENWVDEKDVSHIGLRDMILQFYHPEEVSRLTGIDEETIIRLGKKYGTADRAVAIGDYMTSYSTNGLYSLMAIHTLNLLKGNVNRKGGITVQGEVPLTRLPMGGDTNNTSGWKGLRYLADGGVAFKTEYRRMDRFLEKVLWQKKQSVDVLFLYKTNPVYSQVNPDAFEEAVSSVPFVVSFSSFIDETTRFADLVLPDHLYLESWEDTVSPPTFPVPIWGTVKPVVSPVYNTLNTGDVLLGLIRELGNNGESSLPFSTMEELLKYRAKGLFQARRGMILDNQFERELTGKLEGRGWWIRPKMEFDEFWKLLIEKGGWCDPFVDWDNWDAVCGNEDKKIHFYVPELREFEGSELASMPHHEGPDIIKELDYPFLLVPYRMSKIDGGESGRVPWVIESSGPMAQLVWDSWVEINPETASKIGLKSGDMVWVESRKGKIQLKTRITEGIVDGVLSVPVGLGHSYGKWANIGSNVMHILQGDQDKRTGLPSWQTTPVKIYRG